MTQLQAIDKRICAELDAGTIDGDNVYDYAVNEMWNEADWTGFTDAQRANVIERVIEGFGPAGWMAGLDAKDGGYGPDREPWVAEQIAVIDQLGRDNMPTREQTGPTREQIVSVIAEIESLQADTPGHPAWGAMTPGEQRVDLEEIEWAGFSREQELLVIGRVLAVEPEELWMRGIGRDEERMTEPPGGGASQKPDVAADEPTGFQVWHKTGQQYEFVASVESNALGAIMMTNHGFMGHERWQDNPRVTAMPGDHRSTTIGDALIGPDGHSLEIASDDGLHLRPIEPIDRVSREADVADPPPHGEPQPLTMPTEAEQQEVRRQISVMMGRLGGRWDEMGETGRMDAMVGGVTWIGFDDDQRLDVMTAVAEGRPEAKWMADVRPSEPRPIDPDLERALVEAEKTWSREPISDTSKAAEERLRQAFEDIFSNPEILRDYLADNATPQQAGFDDPRDVGDDPGKMTMDQGLTENNAQYRQFDPSIAHLRRLWEDGFLPGPEKSWEDITLDRRVELLADYAVGNDVSFDRFVAGARVALEMQPEQQFDGDDEWHLRRHYRTAEKALRGVDATSASDTREFQVWHANNQFAASLMGRYQHMGMPTFPDDYTHVANVSAKDLDGAYALTNHTDTPWDENPGVTMMTAGARSTSMGDVIVDPDGTPYLVDMVGFKETQWPPKTATERVERHLQDMKKEPEILLESTRHFVMPDPEDAASVYDTCDTLGPWDTLSAGEKLAALHELDWKGVGPDDQRRIVEREVDLAQVSSADLSRYFGEAYGKPRSTFDRELEAASRAAVPDNDRGMDR